MDRPYYIVKLDMVDSGIIKTSMRLKQGDSGCVIYLKIFNNGNIYYDEATLPEIYFKRPDGSTVIGSATAGQDNMYVYTIVGNELEMAGSVVMDAKFTLGDGRESSASCSFEVVADTIGATVKASDVYWNDVVKTLDELKRVSAEALVLIADLDEVVDQFNKDITQATQSAASATLSKEEAATSAAGASTSESNAAQSAGTASTAANTATSAADTATQSATEASTAASAAATSATGASTDAGLSKSYAVGTGGEVREGDDLDNAKYYYEKAKLIGDIDFATTEKAGIVKPDGTSVTVEADGTIHAETADDVLTDERMLDTLEEVMANTQAGNVPDALVVKGINSNLNKRSHQITKTESTDVGGRIILGIPYNSFNVTANILNGPECISCCVPYTYNTAWMIRPIDDDFNTAHPNKRFTVRISYDEPI